MSFWTLLILTVIALLLLIDFGLWLAARRAPFRDEDEELQVPIGSHRLPL